MPSTSLTEPPGGRKILSRGGFGEVFVASYLGSGVAVKELNTGMMSSQAMARFIDEAILTARLRHPHIVQCLGLVYEPPAVSLLLEMCANGSLYDVLRKSKGKHTWREIGEDTKPDMESNLEGWGTKSKWVGEIAKGMMYVSERSEREERDSKRCAARAPPPLTAPPLARS